MTTTATETAATINLHPDFTLLPPEPKPTPFTQAALKKLFPAPSPLSITHLSTRDIALYTTVLSNRVRQPTQSPRKAHADYRRRTTAIIASLPKCLLNPTKPPLSVLPQSYLVRLFHLAGATQALPPASKLCNLHGRLNAQVIADALLKMQMETEDFFPDLIVAAGGHSSVSPSLREALTAMQDFCASFLPAEEFMHFYKRERPAKWANPPDCENGCDACMLAKVGGDPQLLMALRASVLARMPAEVLFREERSTRLEWLQGWMRVWGAKGTEMLLQSGRLADELRGLVAAKSAADAGASADANSNVHGKHSAGQSMKLPLSHTMQPTVERDRSAYSVSMCSTDNSASQVSKHSSLYMQPALASSSLLHASPTTLLPENSKENTPSSSVYSSRSFNYQPVLDRSNNRNSAAGRPEEASKGIPQPSGHFELYRAPHSPPNRPLPLIPAYIPTHG